MELPLYFFKLYLNFYNLIIIYNYNFIILKNLSVSYLKKYINERASYLGEF